MANAHEDYSNMVSIGRQHVTNIQSTDDIDGLAGSKDELADLVSCLDKTSARYGIETSAENTKLMTNSVDAIKTKITVGRQELEIVTQFKYLGAIISEEGSKLEVLARPVQGASAMAKLKPIWRDNNISSKIKLLHMTVCSIFLYACETWTLTADLKTRTQTLEMRWLRRFLHIPYSDHITNVDVHSTTT